MRVDEHTKVCGAACHNAMINPLGFAFEHFDGMGQFRETEQNGNETLPIDSSGSFDFIDGTKTYRDAAELMTIAASDQQSHLCYAKKLASFGLQRDIIDADLTMLANLSSVSTASGGSVKQVIVELVKQDKFRIRAGGAL
jgi:fructose-1,6-bisphosphatase/sedoheptulose 1,7-bisphosphatase-like protein